MACLIGGTASSSYEKQAWRTQLYTCIAVILARAHMSHSMVRSEQTLKSNLDWDSNTKSNLTPGSLNERAKLSYFILNLRAILTFPCVGHVWFTRSWGVLD